MCHPFLAVRSFRSAPVVKFTTRTYPDNQLPRAPIDLTPARRVTVLQLGSRATVANVVSPGGVTTLRGAGDNQRTENTPLARPVVRPSAGISKEEETQADTVTHLLLLLLASLCFSRTTRPSVIHLRTCALPSSLQREGLEQLRGYESEDERRCMIEREYAGCEHGLLATRPLPSALPSPLPFKGIRGSAEGRRHRRPQDSERVPCRPIVSR